MSKRFAGLASPHDVLLPENDLQALHKAEGEGAADDAAEEKTVADAALGSQIRGTGPQGAALRVPKLLADASHQGNAPLAHQSGGRRLY